MAAEGSARRRERCSGGHGSAVDVVLLGFAAISIDIGANYAEKRQLQNGADAAALALAQDTLCKSASRCHGRRGQLGQVERERRETPGATQ
ncbi:hypothetical protein GS498_06695 [Rhodococcus hoagii]|nr:hypothetical protein [Prescottella equi]